MTTDTTRDVMVADLWKRRHELTQEQWAEAAPVLLGFLVANTRTTASPADVERVARAAFEAAHYAGPIEDEPINWGRGGYKTQVAMWQAVARAAIAALATPPAPAEPVNALVEALETVTNSLEAELKARYPIEAEGHSPYPGMKRRYDRDMAEVHDARAALAAYRSAPTGGEAV